MPRVIYRRGQDIINAQTGQVIGATDWTQNWSGRADVQDLGQAPEGHTYNAQYGQFVPNQGPAYNPPSQPTQPSSQSNQPTQPTNNFQSQITSYLNQGYDNPDDIARELGIDVSEVNSAINSDYNLSYILNTNRNTNQMDEAFNDYRTRINNISRGVFTLSPEEQAQIDSINRLFDQLREQQIIANKNYEGTTELAGIRSGRQEFMTQIAQGEYKEAVDSGIKKIADLDAKALSSISNLKQLFKENRYKEIEDEYTNLSKYLNEKSQSIKDIYNATKNMYDEIEKKAKEERDAITAELNQQKLKQEIGIKTITELAPSISESLTGDATKDSELIKSIADYYDIDENLIRGGLAKYRDTSPKAKFEEDILQKGFRTINPNDVKKMRDSGNEVIEYKGKAYMKEGKLTSKTIKGKVHWYNAKGQEVFPQGKNTPIIPTTITPEIPLSEKKKLDQATTEMTQAMREVSGDDGYIAPDNYTILRKQWVDKGFNPTTFDTKFKGFRNPNNPYYITNKK